jgi:putative endonuclease
VKFSWPIPPLPISSLPTNTSPSSNNPSPYWVYVILCQRPCHLYVGMTRDLRSRLKQHETGRGSRFTKRHGFRSLIELLPASNYEEAIALETAMVRSYQALQHYLVSGGSIHEKAAHNALEEQPFPWDEAHSSCPLPHNVALSAVSQGNL